MRILLDTCTFLWIAEGSSQLSTNAKVLFRDPGNEVFLSAISAWEITIKSSLGRLPLPDEPQMFVRTQREAHAIDTLSIDENAALHLNKLPVLHNDPFDRMLVCQSIVHGMTILTPDKLISAYPARTVW
jgi:PIN domain nuclease of toxin-antitoxin system